MRVDFSCNNPVSQEDVRRPCIVDVLSSLGAKLSTIALRASVVMKPIGGCSLCVPFEYMLAVA
jgi:hypothetical protein